MESLEKEVQATLVVHDKHGKPEYKMSQLIKAFCRLGRGFKISPKANVNANKPGYKLEYHVDSISLTIGIGTDYTAELTMTEDAWKALKAGEKVSITTTRQYKEQYGG